MKRRILGDVPGVARRQYFPSPSNEYLSVRALPPELERGTFCRACAFHRPGGSVASTKRHSRSVSGLHAPLPRARLSLCLSLSLSFSRRPHAASLCAGEHPGSIARIHRASLNRSRDISRWIDEISNDRSFVETESAVCFRDTRQAAQGAN